MRINPLENMTSRELAAEYNSHGPRWQPKTWKGEKYDLLLRVRTAAGGSNNTLYYSDHKNLSGACGRRSNPNGAS